MTSKSCNRIRFITYQLPVILGYFLLTASPTWAWEPWSYIAEPIDGRVLDKETGQPIEGAVVVANWELAKPPEGNTDAWVIIETVTEADGRYHIPGWGPKTRPWFRWFDHQDPNLIVFKPGYWHESYSNGDPYFLRGTNPPGAKIRKSYWNGRDISLVPFRMGQEIEQGEIFNFPEMTHDDKTKKIKMTEEKWVDQLQNVQLSVDWSGGRSDEWGEKEWLRIKTLIRAINEECTKLSPQRRIGLTGVPKKYRASILGDVAPCP